MKVLAYSINPGPKDEYLSQGGPTGSDGDRQKGRVGAASPALVGVKFPIELKGFRAYIDSVWTTVLCSYDWVCWGLSAFLPPGQRGR